MLYNFLDNGPNPTMKYLGWIDLGYLDSSYKLFLKGKKEEILVQMSSLIFCRIVFEELTIFEVTSDYIISKKLLDEI